MLALLRRALRDERGHAGRAAGGRRRARVPRRALRAATPAPRSPRSSWPARPSASDAVTLAPGRGRAPAQGDPLRQGRRPPLRPDLGLDQVHARLRPRRLAALPRGDARGRRGPALHRPPDGHPRERGHRQRRPARARGGGGGGARGRARGHARVRAEPRPGRGLPVARAEVERRQAGARRARGVGARARRAGAARRPAQRRLPGPRRSGRGEGYDYPHCPPRGRLDRRS